jgi:hypothetical protein
VLIRLAANAASFLFLSTLAALAFSCQCACFCKRLVNKLSVRLLASHSLRSLSVYKNVNVLCLSGRANGRQKERTAAPPALQINPI